MSTTIKATCPNPDCGDVSLKRDDVTVRVCVDTREGSYRFRCPKCSHIVLKNATPETISLLLGSGVAREEWSLPHELFEPHPPGAPITLDDVLTMHEFLEGGGFPE